MADLIESAQAILSHSQRRMEATANNVANITTPGFKTEHLYSDVSMETVSLAPQLLLRQRLDLAQGKLAKTNNPLDLAIAGAGLFQLRGADGSLVYSRSGQFRLGDDGRVLSPQGLALQSSGGGDLAIPNPNVKILADGTVLDGERPVAKVALFVPRAGAPLQALGGSLYAIAGADLEEAQAPELRQGMLESSNVGLADEMVTMMDALRQAESGARLVQSYDDLMGRAISTLGSTK